MKSPYDWGYQMFGRDNVSSVFNDNSVPLTRGKGLGGTRNAWSQILMNLSLPSLKFSVDFVHNFGI